MKVEILIEEDIVGYVFFIMILIFIICINYLRVYFIVYIFILFFIKLWIDCKEKVGEIKLLLLKLCISMLDKKYS